jgi:hypothetical protein
MANSKMLQYESSVPIQPAPVVSSAPVWDAVSKLAGNLEKTVGTIAIKEKEIALEANKYDSATQIAHQSTDAYLKASRNPNVEQGMNEFHSAMNGIATGILSQTPERNIPYVKRMLVYHAEKFNAIFARRESQQSQAIAYNKLVKAYDVHINQMSNDFYNGNQHNGKVLHGQITNMINDGIKTGLLDASRGALFSKHLESKFRESTVLGQYRAAINNGTQKEFRKKFMKGYNSWFDVSGKERMLNQFDSLDNQKAAKDGINAATYDLIKKQLVYDVYNGRPLNTGKLADLIAASSKRAPTTLNDINNAKEQYNITSPVKYGTLTDIQSKIHWLEDPNNIPKDVNEASNNLKAAIFLKNYYKKLINDPVQTIQENPAYKEKLQEIKATGEITPTQLNISFQRQMGFKDEQIHALDTNTTHQVITALQTMPLENQIGQLDRFLDAHATSSRHFIIKDLQRAGLPLASQYLYRISKSTNPQIQNMTIPAAIAWNHIQTIKGAPQYVKALNDYSNILKLQLGTDYKAASLEIAVTGEDSFENKAKVLISQGGDVSGALTNFQAHAELLTAQLVTQGQKISEAAQNATSAMLTGLSFDTYKGNTIAYDSEIPHSLLFGSIFGHPGVLEYMNQKTAKEDIQIPDGYKIAHPTIKPATLKASYLSNTSFATTPDESGIFLIDVNYSSVKLKDGSRIILKFDDLKDHNSQLMNDYMSWKKDRMQIKVKKLPLPFMGILPLPHIISTFKGAITEAFE